jgi:hypothetical protein
MAGSNFTDSPNPCCGKFGYLVATVDSNNVESVPSKEAPFTNAG